MKHISPATLLKGMGALALFLSISMSANAQKPDSKQISDLFSEIKQHASLAEDDAEKLESYTRTNITWQTQANQLRRIKGHVDELLSDYNEAARLRDEASPWQQEAIDKLLPVMKDMADHLTATLQHHNENPTQVKQGPYVDYVRGLTQYTSQASALIDDVIDYGAARSTAESLERRLDLPANKE